MIGTYIGFAAADSRAAVEFAAVTATAAFGSAVAAGESFLASRSLMLVAPRALRRPNGS